MSQKCFVVYEPASGRILRSGHCPEHDIVHQAVGENEAALETPALVGDSQFYIVDRLAVPRPPSTIAGSLNVKPGSRNIILTGIPVGCNVEIGGPVHGQVLSDGPDGGLLLTVPVGGVYTIFIDPFPAEPFRQSFNVE